MRRRRRHAGNDRHDPERPYFQLTKVIRIVAGFLFQPAVDFNPPAGQRLVHAEFAGVVEVKGVIAGSGRARFLFHAFDRPSCRVRQQEAVTIVATTEKASEHRDQTAFFLRQQATVTNLPVHRGDSQHAADDQGPCDCARHASKSHGDLLSDLSVPALRSCSGVARHYVDPARAH